MITLRPDNQIDRRLAAQDLAPLRLGDAAGHGDARVETARGPFLLQNAHLAQFREDLLRGVLTNVAGVQHNEVGVLDGRCFFVSFACEHICHTCRIIDVHLTAIRLDENLALRRVAVAGGRVTL